VREVTVATVVRPMEGPALAVRAASPEEAAALRAQVKRGRQAVAERALKETADVLRLSAATVTSRIVTGHPVEAIVRLAKKERADLLVVGSRGLRGMMAKAMGSVSLAVAQSAPCAVLVVKPG
jgi:nucleotide-binding universal stress UspA family protein